jgi:hypothetical protein
VVACLAAACSNDQPVQISDVDDTVATTPPSSPVITTAGPDPVVAVTQPGSPSARIDALLDAAQFASGLSQAELIIRDAASTPEQIAAAGAQLQLLIRELADRPELDETVIAAVDPVARPTIERIIRARQFVQARSAADPSPSAPSPTLPAWTIVAPLPVGTLLGHYAEAEAATGVPWYWLAAIHLQETRMGRIQGVSSAGAVGPMQFLPTTWAECCSGDPLQTRDAIVGAATYLAQNGAPADMPAALFQYNPNEGYVAVVTAYAENMRDAPALYDGYHAFQVFYSSAAGTVRLPIGFSQSQPVDAAAYLADHPADAA